MRYQVIVGNVGTVYDGNDPAEARAVFGEYKALALQITGRAAGESVTLFRDGEIELFSPEPEHDWNGDNGPECQCYDCLTKRRSLWRSWMAGKENNPANG